MHIEISESKLGTKPKRYKNTIHGRDTAVPPILCTGLGGNFRKDKPQEKLTRVQRLINIKIAKAYRTVSNEALCIITGLTPTHIKIKETAELYKTSEETDTRTC